MLYTETQILQMLLDCGFTMQPCDSMNCETLSAAMDLYLSQTVPTNLAAFMNPIFGPHTISYYQAAFEACQTPPGPLLCNEPMFPSIYIAQDSLGDCLDGVYQFAYTNALSE
jgi:hypothetical protein